MRRFPPPSPSLFVLVAASLFGAGCADRNATAPDAPERNAVDTRKFDVTLMRGKEPSAGLGSPSTELLGDMSRALRGRGAHLAVAEAEAFTVPEGSPAGMVLLASDRTLRFPSRWVPGDPRRNADGNRITYLVTRANGTARPGLSPDVTEAAIDRAMATWATRVPCAPVEIVKRADTGADATVVDYAAGMGGYGNPFLADVVDAGFWPSEFFEKLAPRGSLYILGVTFTLVFTDDAGNPTDMDGDGCLDVAVKEVYYNDHFDWSVGQGGFGGYDLETVALHENGHALGLGHFGNIFVTRSNGDLHISPRAVMNAAYLGVLHRPLGTDRAALCGIYARWPER